MVGFFSIRAEAAVPTPTFTFPDPVTYIGNPFKFSFVFPEVPFAEGKYPGLAILACKDGEDLSTCYNEARKGARGIVSAEGTSVSGKKSFSYEMNTRSMTQGTYILKLGVAWWNDQTKVGGIVGNGVFDSQKVVIDSVPVIEMLSPLPTTVLQPGNKYRFSFQWKNFVGAERKWAFNFTRVMDGAITATDGLDAAFKNLFRFNEERVDGKDGPVYVDFTIPTNQPRHGSRKFSVTLLPYDKEGQPQADKKITVERILRVTSVKGDVTGDGCVGITDLSEVAQFIMLRGTDKTTQETSYPTELLRYDINGDGVVENDDLAIQARNFNNPRCANL